MSEKNNLLRSSYVKYSEIRKDYVTTVYQAFHLSLVVYNLRMLAFRLAKSVTEYLTIIPRVHVGYEMVGRQGDAKRQVGYNHLISSKREWNNCFTVEPARAFTSRRRPPPISDNLPKTPKMSSVTTLYGKTGGHFACACKTPLNDNSVGASNLMAGNRKLARKVTVLLKAISLVL